MTKAEIIAALRKNFDVRELVCPHTYARSGEKSFLFLQTPALHTLLVLRTQILKVPLIINTYPMHGTVTQRGLRCNLCPLVKEKTDKGILYQSPHPEGLAWDIVSPEMSAEQMRQKIYANASLLPYPVRIEDNGDGTPNWLHIDCYDTAKGNKITPFKG